MHIVKLSVAVCVLALGPYSLLAQRPDTAAQAAARDKLRAAEAQFEAQQGTAPTPAAPTAPAPAVPAPPAPAEPTPVAAAPSPSQPVASQPTTAPASQIQVFTPAPATPTRRGGLSPDAEERAREQLHQAEAQLQAQQPVQPVVQQQPVVKSSVKTKPVKPVKNVAKNNPPPTVTAPKKNAKSVKATGAPAPAPMIMGSKEQKLADLLQLYKADKITPAEYHEQRAKILAEP